jgi:hypothetical protein
LRRVGGHEDRVSVGLRLQNRQRRKVAIGARLVLNHYGRVCGGPDAFSQTPGHGVGRAARRERHDEIDPPRRIGRGIRHIHPEQRNEQAERHRQARAHESFLDINRLPPLAGRQSSICSYLYAGLLFMRTFCYKQSIRFIDATPQHPANADA